ncbi:hypothetical protein QTI33_29420 [Variovorax sp. J22P271]|uniref:hypothetical protein n=1 Tax=Variovorax davisae TaxID=3053515 RepID=UPI002577BA4A|nr:hypothetical protein [Variovorax sp. J22P271]MDM0036289.1 hypothetical protein [Variovorax sp. J22P271]
MHEDLTRRLSEIEEKTERLELSHDMFSGNTPNQLRQLFEAMRALTVPPDPPPKRPIGFAPPEEKKTPKARSKT